MREPRVELFRLDQDPLEKSDLSANHPDQVRAMLDKLKRFRALRPSGGVPPMTAPPPPGWKAPSEWTISEE